MKKISLGPMSVKLQVWSQLKLLILPHFPSAFAPPIAQSGRRGVAQSRLVRPVVGPFCGWSSRGGRPSVH